MGVRISHFSSRADLCHFSFTKIKNWEFESSTHPAVHLPSGVCLSETLCGSGDPKAVLRLSPGRTCVASGISNIYIYIHVQDPNACSYLCTYSDYIFHTAPSPFLQKRVAVSACRGIKAEDCWESHEVVPLQGTGQHPSTEPLIRGFC